jgi:hypothetical protein
VKGGKKNLERSKWWGWGRRRPRNRRRRCSRGGCGGRKEINRFIGLAAAVGTSSPWDGSGHLSQEEDLLEEGGEEGHLRKAIWKDRGINEEEWGRMTWNERRKRRGQEDEDRHCWMLNERGFWMDYFWLIKKLNLVQVFWICVILTCQIYAFGTKCHIWIMEE